MDFCLHACFLSGTLLQFNLRLFVKGICFQKGCREVFWLGFFYVEKVKHLSSWLKGTCQQKM